MFKQFIKPHHLGIILCILFMIPAPASSNLLITPLQVVLEGRERATDIVIVNTSEDTNTYRIYWEQLYQVENEGGYVPADEDVRKKKSGSRRLCSIYTQANHL